MQFQNLENTEFKLKEQTDDKMVRVILWFYKFSGHGSTFQNNTSKKEQIQTIRI